MKGTRRNSAGARVTTSTLSALLVLVTGGCTAPDAPKASPLRPSPSETAAGRKKFVAAQKRAQAQSDAAAKVVKKLAPAPPPSTELVAALAAGPKAEASRLIFAHVKKHRRLPLGVAPNSIGSVVASLFEGDNAIGMAAAGLGVVAVMYKERNEVARQSGAKLESVILAQLMVAIEKGRLHRQHWSEQLLQLAFCEKYDASKTDVSNAEVRSRRRLVDVAIRLLDRRRAPHSIDPYAAPKRLRIVERDDGKTVAYSVGSDGKDNGGDATKDIALAFVRSGKE